MSRDITGGVISAMEASTVRPLLLFEGEFDSGYVRFNTSEKDYTYSSNVYLGNGWFFGAGSATESTDLSANGITINLTGIPESLLSLILGQTTKRLRGNVYLAFLDSSEAIIADPVTCFSGWLDEAIVKMEVEGSTAELSYENELIDLERPRNHRYTDESQKQFYPLDKGFEYVAGLQDWSALWGRPKSDKTKKPTKPRTK